MTQNLQNTISKSTEPSIPERAKQLTDKLRAEIFRLKGEIRYLEGAIEGIRLINTPDVENK